METSEAKAFFIGMFIGLAVGGYLMGVSLLGQRVEWRAEAIEHGAARFAPTTGEFEWLPTKVEVVPDGLH